MRCQVTDIHAWPAMVKLLLIAVPCFVCMVGVAINVYTTLSRDYHVVCDSITTSPYMEMLKVTWGSSTFKWRVLLMCAIGGLVIFPGRALRLGQLSPDELKAFPPNLRLRFLVALWLTAVGFIGAAAVTLVLELSKSN